jgi:spore coat polysaccharide biosynthesis protein SpsF
VTDAIVVRLTADNVVPDGSFIQRLISTFKNASSPYLGTGSPVDGLPYGLSAEAFTVAALREADSQATSEHDREHVTPWLARRYGREMFGRRQLGLNDLAHLRCTLDSLDDYLRLCALFDGVDEPVRVPWEDLVGRLARLADAPHGRVPYKLVRGVAHGTLALGTAQLGWATAPNTSGLPGRDVCRRIVRKPSSMGSPGSIPRVRKDSETRVGEVPSRFARTR